LCFAVANIPDLFLEAGPQARVEFQRG
jgi:hypothetical protein